MLKRFPFLVVILALSACGQSGALYLPEKKPKAAPADPAPAAPPAEPQADAPPP